MATKSNEEQTPTPEITADQLTPMVKELIEELRQAVRPLDPKKCSLRQAKRGIANIEAILADIKVELAK